jgi:hypothetical protein
MHAMLIEFIGTRQRDFTVEVNGNKYYVRPGQLLPVALKDGLALIERDPHLWQRAGLSEPEPQQETEPRPTRRKEKSEG